MSDPIDLPDPDLDTLTRGQLAEWAHMPEIAATADVLDEWLLRAHGVTSSAHNVGLFLDLLAAEGYRVEPIEAPSFEDVMPFLDCDEPAGDCTDPPGLQCSDAGCPEHGFDRDRDDEED